MNYAGANTGRRCSTYRSTVIPAIPSADCLDATNRARFNDYNYAFSGIQGEGGEFLHFALQQPWRYTATCNALGWDGPWPPATL